MSAVVIIPARYSSTRFPGKPLVPLKGKPLIQHVYENSKGARLADDVIVATDSETIFERVLSFGGRAVMTSPVHPSGTDRIAEVAASMKYDIIVNVQGDEPLIRPEMIDDVIDILSDCEADMGTLVKKIDNPSELWDPNVVKVVFNDQGFALYFSRSPIPYHRDEWKGLLFTVCDLVPQNGAPKKSSTFWGNSVFKHIGIYSYRREALLRLAGMRPTRLEVIERLEQLRALENNMKIKVRETLFETIGVDTPEDMERVEKCLNSYL
jgi:3-deoxy-manno-octulosonate cytidylyltransferase (CMP-KDO synthetase)